MQAKLLRFLQDGEVQRLGSSDVFRVDVRVLCATNVNLLNHVKQKLFRQDLYYRIAVFPMELPPLRERPEDIGPLAEKFLDDFCREAGVPAKRLSASSVAFLRQAQWPGNVRELQHSVERAFILAGQELQLHVEHFSHTADPSHFRTSNFSRTSPADRRECAPEIFLCFLPVTGKTRRRPGAASLNDASKSALPSESPVPRKRTARSLALPNEETVSFWHRACSTAQGCQNCLQPGKVHRGRTRRRKRAADPQALAHAFLTFTQAAGSLEKSYGQLQAEVGRLRADLERANAELSRSLEETSRVRAFLGRILEGLPCGVLVTEGDGQPRMVNPEARRLLGLEDWHPEASRDCPASIEKLLSGIIPQGARSEQEWTSERCRRHGLGVSATRVEGFPGRRVRNDLDSARHQRAEAHGRERETARRAQRFGGNRHRTGARNPQSAWEHGIVRRIAGGFDRGHAGSKSVGDASTGRPALAFRDRE